MTDLVKTIEMEEPIEGGIVQKKVKAYKFGHEFTKTMVNKVKENQTKKEDYYEMSEMSDDEKQVEKIKTGIVS